MKADQQLKGEYDDFQKEALSRWMAQPSTRFMLSLVPPTGGDALDALIRSAFETGFAAGIAASAMIMMKSMEEIKRDGRTPR